MADPKTGWHKLAGAAISVAAIGYFAWELAFGIDWTNAAQALRDQGRLLPVALLLYLLAFVPMCAGWHVALALCGASVTRRSSARIFLISQFAKYLPGNIGHLVGRVVLARGEGIAASTASAAMLVEIVGVLTAACVLVLAALALGAVPAAEMPLLLLAAFGIALVCGGAAAFLLRARLSSLRFDPQTAGLLIGLFVMVFVFIGAAQMVLLFSSGASLPGSNRIILVFSAILISWLAGFLTPGAPAGLGVREVSLAVLLNGVFEHDQIVLAAAGMRLVTLVGDALMWGAGLSLRDRRARAARVSG